MNERLVGGRYQIHRLIGSGGMADVYLAVDQVLGREVAVKLLRAISAGNPTVRERFKREARAVAALNHPNIVSIYDWGEVQGDAGPTRLLSYIVMQYVAGPDLGRMLRERGRLAERAALDIAIQITRALEAAHARGFVHRDVKPRNVLLTEDAQVKVTDFGIARGVGLPDLTTTGAVTGTAHYLSPEQAQGHALDARSDLYSLGIVLYEMLAGRLPFEGASLVEVALRHLHAVPPLLHAARPDVSSATEAVVSRSLAKDPADRFASAADMRRALEAARAQLNVADAEIQEATQPLSTVVSRQKNANPPVVLSDRPSVPGTFGRRKIARLAAVPAALAFTLVGLFLALHGREPPGPRRAGHRVHQVAARHATVRPFTPTIPPVTATVRKVATATVPPPTAAPAPSATAQVAIAPSRAQSSGTVNNGSPQGAVASFYYLVSTKQFAAAAQLWSARMQQSFPPNVNIAQRFSATTSLTVRHLSVVDEKGNQATIFVDLVEVKGQTPTAQEITGTWQLVRDHGSWFLDWPDLHAV